MKLKYFNYPTDKRRAKATWPRIYSFTLLYSFGDHKSYAWLANQKLLKNRWSKITYIIGSMSIFLYRINAEANLCYQHLLFLYIHKHEIEVWLKSKCSDDSTHFKSTEQSSNFGYSAVPLFHTFHRQFSTDQLVMLNLFLVNILKQCQIIISR